jgi:hypothetical protein
MTDAKWEIGATLAVAVALLLFFTYHKGKGTPSHVVPLTLPQQTQQDANAIQDYNPASDIPNGVDLSGVNFSFPLQVSEFTPSFNFPVTTPNVPLNVSNGTPQCGCTSSNVSTYDDLLNAQRDAFNRILAALENIPQVKAMPVINVNITKPEPFSLEGLWRPVADYATMTDVEKAGANLRRGFGF